MGCGSALCTPRTSPPLYQGQLKVTTERNFACLEALKAVPLSQPLRIITDSKYVYDGVTAHMHRWAMQGRWVTNHNLWESLKSLLQAAQQKPAGSMFIVMCV